MTDAPEPGSGGAQPPRGRPLVEASRRVAQIMRAAEDAATELTADAERRADARIAEATRAADNRVAAAEEEAAEILAAAQHQASVLTETAEAHAARVREEAKRDADRFLEEARQEAEEVQRIAEVFAVQTREAAEEDARKHVERARGLASEVLADGTEMSHNLGQLTESLRRNAETLLRDVTRAHRALTARLDQAGVASPGARPINGDETALPSGAAEFGDIPEFIPRTPRRSR